MPTVISILSIIFLTLLSGYGDARGFLHASRMWEGNALQIDEVLKSAAGFAVGIIAFWVVLRSVIQFGIISPESQTLAWFAFTLIGVAVMSGAFLHWRTLDQMLAVLVALGMGILLYRTSS